MRRVYDRKRLFAVIIGRRDNCARGRGHSAERGGRSRWAERKIQVVAGLGGQHATWRTIGDGKSMVETRQVKFGGEPCHCNFSAGTPG